MKTSIIILLILFLFIFVYEIIVKEKQIKKQDEIIKAQLIETIHLKKQIIELKKPLPIGMITVSKKTLQVVTGRPDRFLHTKELKQGRNYYDFAMHEGQRVEIVIWNY